MIRFRFALLSVIYILTTTVNLLAQEQPGGLFLQSASHRTVAVVPFTNATADLADEWIGQGIAESLINELHGRLDITVATSLDAASSALEIGRRADAQWVITGSYKHLDNQIHIEGQLVDVNTGAVQRSSVIDGPFDQLFALQDQLAAELTVEFMKAQNPSATLAATPQSKTDIDVVGDRALVTLDGPSPPVPPNVIARDEEGRATVRAVRVEEPIVLDGRLDESIYDATLPLSGFIQQVPNEGAPASEQTEAWLLFDDTNIYLAARCYDSAPPDEWIANDMRRDTAQLRQNDTLAIILDTYYDRRNGVAFYTNPLAARADFAITNEGNPNSDWNPVWDVRTGRFEGGWTVEMEIPFKSLRYRPGVNQVWGFQLRRVIRRKNEGSYLTPLPIEAARGGAIRGIFRVSDAATLVGLEVPQGNRNIEIKPYGIGGITTDLTADPIRENRGDGAAGVDVKLGLTQNLTADFTYNTDFAQVEVDEQQVNLTRFNLFFPEKREFFLEGRGIFEFASGAAIGGPGGFRDNDAPILFYSRRIGLMNNRVVPIIGGGRVTGKVGPFDVGALSIQADEEQLSEAVGTNFTVARIKRDILRKSSIGTIFTNRSVSTLGDGASQTYGIDGTFSFYDNVHFLGYAARTESPGLHDENTSYQGKFDYTGDTFGLQANHLLVEDNFVPEIGFVRRDNFRRTFLMGRVSPRPQAIEMVRQFTVGGTLDYTLTADTALLETRVIQLGLETEFENSDQLQFSLRDNYELLQEPFSPGDNQTIAIGGYDFTDFTVSYLLGQQHAANGRVSLSHGGYFNGDITSIDFGRGYVALTEHLSVEPSVSFNWIDLPQGSFRTDLARARVNYTFTPRMFFGGLIQYNSSNNSVGANLRFRWEYSPGSELFIVYTEDRDTTPFRPIRTTELLNRGFVVKFNRLFRL